MSSVLADLHKSPSALEGGYFRFGTYELCGHGEKTKSDCGGYIATKVCPRVELHGGLHFEKGKLVDHTGQIYVKKIFDSCDRPSCPTCYKYGWATREARRIEHRLAEASKLLGKGNRKSGLVEHIITSFPEYMWALPIEVLRKKAVEALYARGVFGGVLIFHGARFGRIRRWHLGIHFHVLGFIRGGYGCRGCKKLCSAHSCNGFEARTRAENVKDCLIVKVAQDENGEVKERGSVGGTAWYQLHHACIVHGVKRPHVSTWFGSCSYRKLKVVPMIKIHAKCPMCGSELVDGSYFGSQGSGMRGFWASPIENGVEVYSLKLGKQFRGSGSYGEDC